MSILEMPVPQDVLTEIVEDTIFAQQERFTALLRDIREFLRTAPAGATAANCAAILNAAGRIAGDKRRQVIREFFEAYPENATAGEILSLMETV
ncbi:hypothetical protein [Acetobacter cerevisiae]|uniref:hypothetical protein n=1 Tax=Acetobacter cerevisiae TaxID=178900 RepID=UPI00209D98C2|nr:hypothetical protein [Acetobacter cerevisiae]MCP1270926.1 hypothetical protein [Acetobacter cerevisiae]MCP1278843.1 hypothetical protein [Acetobacter cerevisiae]